MLVTDFNAHAEAANQSVKATPAESAISGDRKMLMALQI